jgi:hypothetical protein
MLGDGRALDFFMNCVLKKKGDKHTHAKEHKINTLIPIAQ